MMRLMPLFIISFFSLNAFSETLTFKKESCSVEATSTLQLAIGSEKIASDVKVEFVFAGQAILLPKVRLTFLSHEPASASIQWNDISISKSKVQMFTNDIAEHVRLEEGKAFAMKRVSPVGQVAVFETSLTNFGRAQNLVALFLSQGKMIINASPEEGDLWQAEHSLKNSDESVRQLAFNCYQASTVGYLTEKGQRIPLKADPGPDKKKMATSAQHWSDGYGVTNFSWVNEQLPLAFRYPFELVDKDADEVTNNKQLAVLYRLAKEKRSTQETFIQSTTQPQYIELNNQLSSYYDQLNALYTRFVVVTGSSDQATDSLLQQKISEQKILSSTIAQLSVQISQQKQVEGPLQQEYDSSVSILNPHLAQLNLFDNEKKTRVERMQTIALLQTHLAALLSEQEEILKKHNANAEGLTSAPWSVEEIEKQIVANKNRDGQIATIRQLKVQLELISSEVNVLLEKANAQQTAALAYTEAVATQNRLKRELTQEEEWLYQSRQIPNLTIMPTDYFTSINKVFGDQLAEAKITRDDDGEYNYHESRYYAAEKEFLANLEKAKSVGQSVIAAVICKPDVFMDANNRKTPCLAADDALDATMVESFFNSLPTENLNALMVNVQKPWQQDVSKTQILIDRFHNELNQATPELQAVLDVWGQLRHIIWRWVEMQKAGDGFSVCTDPKAIDVFKDNVYSEAFYETIFKCQKAAVEVHEANKATILASLQQTDTVINNSFASFDSADQEFANLSVTFVTSAMAKIKTVSEQMDFTKLFSACALPLEKVEDCALTLTTGVSESQTKIATEELAYVDITKALVMSINFQTTQLVQENANLVSSVATIDQNKATYTTNNNLEVLMSRQEELKIKLANVESQITDLTKKESEKKSQLATLAQTEVLLRDEASQLATQIQNSMAQIKALLPAYQPYCSAILPSSNRLQEIDASIYEVLGQEFKAADSKVYSSCQMPNLENYIPNRTILNTPLTTPRSL